MFHLFQTHEKRQDEDKTANVEEDFSDITYIAEYFESLSGITFHKQLSILESKTKTFCRLRNIYSYDELLQQVQCDKELRQEFIDHLTTNETFFYREFNQIEELVRCVKGDGGVVRILCAPCASGEESYSIVIALLEAGVSADMFHILGIDINKDAIQRAQRAAYRGRSVENLSEDLKKRYFLHKEERYHLKEGIKKLVDFKVINIFDKEFLALGTFDYIFCRNMLIYFDYATKQRAKEILQTMLKDDAKKIFFGHADLL